MMTLSQSHLAYAAEAEVLDRALETARGIRLPVPNYDAAQHYRHRLHKARAVERKRSQEIYAFGEPGYGVSPWDELIVTIRPEGEQFYVYVKRALVPKGIEEIPEDVPMMQPRIAPPEPARPAMPQLEFKRRI